MKKTTIIIAAVLVIFLVGYLQMASQVSNRIENEILKDTPIGSSKQVVLGYCLHEKLRCQFFENSGFLKQESGQPMRTIGNSYLESELADYFRLPFFSRTETAFWGFDENGKLIEVWVWVVNDGS